MSGLFSQESFVFDIEADAVTSLAIAVVSIRRHSDGGGIAKFAGACYSCALRSQ